VPRVGTISARITGGTGGFSPHCNCGPHVIHDVEVSALSAPWCCPPLLFFLVRSLGTTDRLAICDDILKDIWAWREHFINCYIFVAGE